MRLVRRALFALLVVVLVALVGGYWYERPMLLTGTGYAAHNACAVTNVAGRANPETDLPPNPLVPVLRSSASGENGVQGSVLGVLARQTSWFNEGYGCTLAEQAPDLGVATEVTKPHKFLTTGEVPVPAELQAAVDKAFGDGLSAKDAKALGTRAIVVVRDGEIIAERYAKGFSPDTPQLGWSMSKSIANLFIGRLVHEGKIKITDSHLRKEWTDERANITIEDLMRMTSGLSWDETYDLGTPITKMLYIEPDMGKYVASQSLAHPVGSFQQYSSGSTTLMCDIVTDKVTDGSAHAKADLVRTELFEPLGLTTAVFEPDAVGTPVCSSYLWATPREWAALGQFAADNGAYGDQLLLDENWIHQSNLAKPVDKFEENNYAAGWRANLTADGEQVDMRLPSDAFWAQGHDGQWMVIVPSVNVVVVRLGFSPTTEDEGVFDLVHDVIG